MFTMEDSLGCFEDRRGGDRGDFLSRGLFDILNGAEVRYVNRMSKVIRLETYGDGSVLT